MKRNVMGTAVTLGLSVAAIALMVQNKALTHLVVYLIPVVSWVFLVVIRAFRYRRFLELMVVGTVLYYGSLLLPDLPSITIRVALPIGLGVAILWPARLGLIGPRGQFAAADQAIRRASRWLREDQDDPAMATELASSLAPGSFPVRGGGWEVAATLYRESLLQRAGSAATTTPASAYERAASDFWRAAWEHDLIGARFHPDVWDEGIAIRCYYEKILACLPEASVEDRAARSDWDVEAEGLIQALRSTPVGDAMARQVRDGVVSLMTDSMVIARGDDSDAAYARQRASYELVRAQFAALEDRENEAVAHRLEASRG